MTANTFWFLIFGFYALLEALCMVSAFIGSNSWLPLLAGFAIGSIPLAAMIEGWPVNKPKKQDRRWLSEFGFLGIFYPFPMILALWGRISEWFLVLSVAGFCCLIWRIIWLRLRYMLTDGDG